MILMLELEIIHLNTSECQTFVVYMYTADTESLYIDTPITPLKNTTNISTLYVQYLVTYYMIYVGGQVYIILSQHFRLGEAFT